MTYVRAPAGVLWSAAMSPPAPTTGPARWRTVALTIVALYPLIVLANAFLTPHLEHLPLLVRSIPIPVLAPPLLVYAAVPLLSRVVHGRRA